SFDCVWTRPQRRLIGGELDDGTGAGQHGSPRHIGVDLEYALPRRGSGHDGLAPEGAQMRFAAAISRCGCIGALSASCRAALCGSVSSPGLLLLFPEQEPKHMSRLAELEELVPRGCAESAQILL